MRIRDEIELTVLAEFGDMEIAEIVGEVIDLTGQAIFAAVGLDWDQAVLDEEQQELSE